MQLHNLQFFLRNFKTFVRISGQTLISGYFRINLIISGISEQRPGLYLPPSCRPLLDRVALTATPWPTNSHGRQCQQPTGWLKPSQLLPPDDRLTATVHPHWCHFASTVAYSRGVAYCVTLIAITKPLMSRSSRSVNAVALHSALHYTKVLAWDQPSMFRTHENLPAKL